MSKYEPKDLNSVKLVVIRKDLKQLIHDLEYMRKQTINDSHRILTVLKLNRILDLIDHDSGTPLPHE